MHEKAQIHRIRSEGRLAVLKSHVGAMLPFLTCTALYRKGGRRARSKGTDSFFLNFSSPSSLQVLPEVDYFNSNVQKSLLKPFKPVGSVPYEYGAVLQPAAIRYDLVIHV